MIAKLIALIVMVTNLAWQWWIMPEPLPEWYRTRGPYTKAYLRKLLFFITAKETNKQTTEAQKNLTNGRELF